MFKHNKTITKVKDVAELAVFTYTAVIAVKGWIGFFRDVAEVVNDKLDVK